jgi:hypothetical protein
MRCECGSPKASYIKEIDNEIHFLCRNCAYHPDECEHAEIVASVTEPMTPNTKTYMAGICKSCLTVRELPSLTGDIQGLFERGRDIADATVGQINGEWYISTPYLLPSASEAPSLLSGSESP